MKRLFSLFTLLSPALVFASENLHEEQVHSVNWKTEVFYPSLNLFVLILLLVFLLKKPIREFFFKRSQDMAKEIEEAAKLKQEIETKYQHYENKMKNIRTEMDSLVKELKEEGDLASKRILEEAEENKIKIEKTVSWVADNELKKAKEQLKNYSTKLVYELAEKEIASKMTPSEQQKIFDKNLNEVEVRS